MPRNRKIRGERRKFCELHYFRAAPGVDRRLPESALARPQVEAAHRCLTLAPHFDRCVGLPEVERGLMPLKRASGIWPPL